MVVIDLGRGGYPVEKSTIFVACDIDIKIFERYIDFSYLLNITYSKAVIYLVTCGPL